MVRTGYRNDLAIRRESNKSNFQPNFCNRQSLLAFWESREKLGHLINKYKQNTSPEKIKKKKKKQKKNTLG